jgi:hypothetical protein
VVDFNVRWQALFSGFHGIIPVLVIKDGAETESSFSPDEQLRLLEP